MTSATDRIPILAKSARRGHAVTLSEHGGDVMRATRVMFGERDRPSPLAGAWLRFFKVPQQRCHEFWRALMVASILHDLGKANSEFQAAVRNPTKMQAIRHEHVTALLLGTGPLADWLDKCLRPVERLAVLSAVASHHCKVGPGSEHGDRELGYNRTGQAGRRSTCTSGHRSCRARLRWQPR
jgi:CRISPR-associated endonuclease/helicase Cas3